MGLDKSVISMLKTWAPAFAGATFLFCGSAFAVDIECVSLNVSSSSMGPRTNYGARISGDGRFIVFESREQAIARHRTKFRDIFYFDRNKNELHRIDPPLQRSNSNPSVSERGRYIVYQSYPLSVVMGEPPLTADIFVYDRYLNKSSIQTFGRGDAALDGENCDPRFSGDGRFLLFTSNATIYPGLKNGITRQIYLFDNDSLSLQHIRRSFAQKV
jgi:Tol biopolymer transport system component